MMLCIYLDPVNGKGHHPLNSNIYALVLTICFERVYHLHVVQRLGGVARKKSDSLYPKPQTM